MFALSVMSEKTSATWQLTLQAMVKRARNKGKSGWSRK
jgi:hypothetical protein